jgi:WhiB family transcriptional regulator, redox-sensing transcriptional regulator
VSEDWRTRARCLFLPLAEVEATFGTDKEQRAFAAAVCCRCPVRVECLKSALAYERGHGESQRIGVFGGFTGVQRLRIATRRAAVCRCGELCAPRGPAAGRCLRCVARDKALRDAGRAA